MKIGLKISFTVALIAPTASAGNFAADSDAELEVVSNRIVTNAHNDLTGEVTSDVRVFAYSFGEDPLDPFFLSDPGFGSETGSGLPQGSQVNFDVLTSLRFWNGSGPMSFASTAGGDFIRFNRAITNVDVSGTSAAQSGFPIANVAAGGTMHAHLNTYLMNADSFASPSEGIYLLAIDVGVSSGGIARSLPTYLLFNNGVTQAKFEDAMQYVATPLPGDANFDGSVDTEDFNLLAGGFGQTGRLFFDGDLDESGTIDSVDFAILAGSYGQRINAPLPGTAVPEPGVSCVLVAMGWLFRRSK